MRTFHELLRYVEFLLYMYTCIKTGITGYARALSTFDIISDIASKRFALQ